MGGPVRGGCAGLTAPARLGYQRMMATIILVTERR
jgi:hypothetical protein